MNDDRLPAVLSIDEDKSENVEKDYDQARANLKAFLDTGKSALETALKIVEDTEHPQAVAAFSALLKSLTDANDRMMSINHSRKNYYKKEHYRDTPEVPPDGGSVTNNYFLGTTTELQKKLTEMRDVSPSYDDDHDK